MSTLNSAIFDDDEENDPDFVPEDQPESEDERGAAAPAADPEDSADREAARAAQEAARAALWASFQTAVAGPGTRSPTAPAPAPRLVAVEKRYRFAGALVTEAVEVPEDSEDAKKWPLLRRSPAPTAQKAGAAASAPAPSPAARAPRDASASAPAESPAGPSTARAPAAPPPSDPPLPPPPPPPGGQARARAGPRRPKTALAAPPAQGKPRKLSTLEKSAMDWRAHVSGSGSGAEPGAGAAEAEGLADELERNRRGGGFLEKVAFLERVGERREELFEGGRKRRRKG